MGYSGRNSNYLSGCLHTLGFLTNALKVYSSGMKIISLPSYISQRPVKGQTPYSIII